ncbi:hypothetical protein HHI36_004348 [Cryptolaemus montrouzieri]|uniref:guanylate cyclase n=1 Tax=Cryptolaemus montrouzieri TaxID=559131 RepID=A0ABD2NRW0_9CUCU
MLRTSSQSAQQIRKYWDAKSEKGWWPALAHAIDVQLREIGITPRHSFIIGRNTSRGQIENKLINLKRHSCTVIVLCLPADQTGKEVLQALDSLHIAQDHNTLMILMDTSNVPSWQNVLRLVSTNDSFSENNTYFTNNRIGINTRKYLLIFSDERNFNKSIEDIVRDNLKTTLSICDPKSNGVNISKTSNMTNVPLIRNDSRTSTSDHRTRNKFCVDHYEQTIVSNFYIADLIEDDSLRLLVEEGIEAMLCCWLQQLQEIGVSDIEKPDLLQGSGTSGRAALRAGGSSPNLAKQIIVDPRVRYNGDLVQMKPVPSSGGGGGEIKDKAIELLVLLHGLRHENLNPLIGCLAESPRAALVSEYCARGSLQDVLQQDDIKLDWSFRLSLLTDLVRGMKYLHSTPIRVHGYLSSRNCVIDARWVLKITDYGLPAFYDAQGISPPVKTARGEFILVRCLVGRVFIFIDVQ